MAYTTGEGVLIFAGTLVIAATAIPSLRKGRWWIRDFDFPRAQIFFSGIAVLFIYLFAFDFDTSGVVFLFLLTCALAIQAWRIYPYTALAPKQVLDSSRARAETTIRLMVANVLMSNRNDAALRERVEEAHPDVLLTVETDGWWQERLRSLERDYPHTLYHPLDNTYGMLLFSRFPFLESEVNFLMKEEIPSFRVRLQLPSEEELLLWCVHPEPPSPTESKTSIERDAELLRVGQKVRGEESPVIVAGDLNDVAWSRTTSLFQRTSGLLDPRIGRGRYSTFHARYPILRWPLDHIFHSRHFKLLDLQVLDAFGSDHFPLLAVLSYEPARKHQQDTPETEDGDRKRAKEKIAQGEEH